MPAARCTSCDIISDGDSLETVGHERLCNNCFRERYMYCESCDEITTRNITGLCFDCYNLEEEEEEEEMPGITCRRCEENYPENEIHYIGRRALCNDCWDEETDDDAPNNPPVTDKHREKIINFSNNYVNLIANKILSKEQIKETPKKKPQIDEPIIATPVVIDYNLDHYGIRTIANAVGNTFRSSLAVRGLSNDYNSDILVGADYYDAVNRFVNRSTRLRGSTIGRSRVNNLIAFSLRMRQQNMDSIINMLRSINNNY